MNEKVRTYLIEAARQKDKFVYYSNMLKDCGFDYDLSTRDGQQELHKLLSEISRFEHANKRPMLTSIAIGKEKNDHGNGFYDLAEEFGFGKNKALHDQFWGFKEADRTRAFWQDEGNFQNHSLILPAKKSTIADLFKRLTEKEEYHWAADWATDYLSFVQNVKLLQQAIKLNPEKSLDDDSLYAGLSAEVQSYENFTWKWLKEKSNGISSRGQSILSEDDFYAVIEDDTFKIIAKASILNPTLNNFNLFSNWWYQNEAIKNRPLLINRAFAACTPETLSSTVDNRKFWKVIEILMASYDFKFTNSHNGNWYAANVELTSWLDAQLKTVITNVSSNRLAQIIWRNIFVWLIYAELHETDVVLPNNLIKRDRPTDGYFEVPERKKTFKGFDTDYEVKAREQKELGDAGEELVVKYEKLRLEDEDLKEKVHIVKDGEGYDVYSFDEFGNEKFIEVKTTTGSALAPFYLSDNELEFMRLNQNHYSLYRIYNYDEENNFGEFFELAGNVEEQLLKKPVQYKVVIKKTNN